MAVMNIKQAQDMLLHLPIEIAILLSANHGVGKSAIVKQVAQILGVPCIDFRLAQCDVADLKGMPFHIKGRTIFAPPKEIPLTQESEEEIRDLLGLLEEVRLGTHGDSGILFLDEINRANREVQNAVFEWIYDRSLNGYKLPSGWRVVAAINGNDGIYNVNQMEPAFLSRFFLIDLKPTKQEWLRWAETEGHIHEAVTQFIRKKDEFLDPTEELLKESSKQGVVKVHDRRAWEMFSKTLIKFEADHAAGKRPFAPLAKTEEAYSELILVCSSFLGLMASTVFKSFIEMDYDALDANVILNKLTKEVKEKLVGIVEKGCIPELAAYNEMIIAYIGKSIKGKLSATQKNNLTEYITLIPNEMVGDFWQKFNQELKDVSEDWYSHDSKTTKRTSDIIMKALVNPNSMKKAAATA